MQSLFHNLLLQDAVFNMQIGQNGSGSSSAGRRNNSADGDDEMTPVMLALQSAFAHMKLGMNGIVDLSRFVGKFFDCEMLMTMSTSS